MNDRKTLTLLAAISLLNSGIAHAQMGGGGGDNAPAFNEPKFSDRLYEAGGPRSRKIHNGKVIRSVVIEGNRSVSTNAILAVMQCREDRIYDDDTFNRDIASLHRTNLFKDIRAFTNEDESGLHIKIAVVEAPLIVDVLFTGNQREEDSALKKQVGISKGDALDPITVTNALGRLIEYYRDRGMNSVDIQIDRELMSTKRIVDFIINEGPVERINSITFRGNTFASSELLKTKISSKDSKRGLLKYAFNIASDSKIEADRETLVAYYREHGFFVAKVDYRKNYDDSGAFVDLEFIIDEGDRYTIKSVSIVGINKYEPAELMPYLNVKAGEYFKQRNKLMDERFICDVYGQHGHIKCDVVGELVFQPNSQVDIVYNVAEGDIYRNGGIRVHIDGEHTKEHVVKHPLGPLREGTIINSRHIDAAKRRLSYSSIFNTDPNQGIVPTIKVAGPEDLPDF